MAIVAAGVHITGVGGCKVGSGIFLNGQGVAICPESNGTGHSKVEESAKASLYGRGKGTVKAGYTPAQIFHGLGQAVIQLGDPMQGAAVSDDLHDKTPPEICNR